MPWHRGGRSPHFSSRVWRNQQRKNGHLRGCARDKSVGRGVGRSWQPGNPLLLRRGAQQHLLARLWPLPWGSLNPVPGDLSLRAALSPGLPDDAGFLLFMLQTSSAAVLSFSPHVPRQSAWSPCGRPWGHPQCSSSLCPGGCGSRGMAGACPLGASSAYHVPPRRPLACSPCCPPGAGDTRSGHTPRLSAR